MLAVYDVAGARVRSSREPRRIVAYGDPADCGCAGDLHVRAASRVAIEGVWCGELVVTLPRKQSGPSASYQWSEVAADRRSLKEAIVRAFFQEHPTRSQRKWNLTGSGVEMALFVSVQAVMLMCIVLVAAELFATA